MAIKCIYADRKSCTGELNELTMLMPGGYEIRQKLVQFSTSSCQSLSAWPSVHSPIHQSVCGEGASGLI